ncbi:MAG TPA: sigma 54-interacting transcriptional regulator [Vicinamibacterales bacterium]|nr:sigma 54-interacting transcriptional regulator [Vicinamibacterales bacterium]
MFTVAESLASDPGSLNAYFDGSQELLHAIADVLDVRSVFPRVSEIAKRMIPHDVLTMDSQDEDWNVQFEATSSDDFRDVALDSDGTPMAAELLIGDLATQRLPLNGSADLRRRIQAGGYRSLLRVATQAHDRRVSVAFWSKQPYAYDHGHLPIAHRIVDHLVLGVSHEHLARTASIAEHARIRRDDVDRRARTIADEIGKGTHRRIVGASAEWREVLTQATRVAKTDTTVLVTGESGTGKEVVARFIHRASARGQGPFVALNCAALPEQLLESELFGYERGAFTSAQQAKPGLIELASGGVLFLDEVSEMSLPAQAKFLRVLQEREFQRLGGTRTLKANIRVIAATNRDLRKAVAKGTFREDLFYRLQVFDIAIAPLRSRTDDILPLSEAMLDEIGRSFGQPPASLTRDAREALLRHDWPGNVRELRNALERAAIRCDGSVIGAEHLALHSCAKPRGDVATDLRRLERDTIWRVLQECDWNKARAAKRLGVTRTQLYGRMAKYHMQLDGAPSEAQV